jgi:plastocyanin
MLLGRNALLGAATVLAMYSVPAHGKSIQIIMNQMIFSPAEANATVGDTIEWINNDILAHTATAKSGDWDATIMVKKTVTTVLTKVGTIEYYCRYHPNMKGTIVVAPR